MLILSDDLDDVGRLDGAVDGLIQNSISIIFTRVELSELVICHPDRIVAAFWQ